MFLFFIFLQLYNRHALYLASQVGSGFDPVVSLTHVKMMAIEYYQLKYVPYRIVLPEFTSLRGFWNFGHNQLHDCILRAMLEPHN